MFSSSQGTTKLVFHTVIWESKCLGNWWLIYIVQQIVFLVIYLLLFTERLPYLANPSWPWYLSSCLSLFVYISFLLSFFVALVGPWVLCSLVPRVRVHWSAFHCFQLYMSNEQVHMLNFQDSLRDFKNCPSTGQHYCHSNMSWCQSVIWHATTIWHPDTICLKIDWNLTDSIQYKSKCSTWSITFHDFFILYFPFCNCPMYNFVFDPSPFLTHTWKSKINIYSWSRKWPIRKR